MVARNIEKLIDRADFAANRGATLIEVMQARKYSARLIKGSLDMQDSATQRAKAIDHLEQALLFAEAIEEPILGYLIERALDEARASQMGGFPGSIRAK